MLNRSQSAEGTTPEIEVLLTELYAKSAAQKYGIQPDEFRGILLQIKTKYLPADAGPAQIREFYVCLRVEELALARACAAGHERAWQDFMLRFREKLYDVAGFITKEASSARELADSLYADLYGTVNRDGKRVSKLSSYTGRGSLEGWLRTVMAQEHVNGYRRQRRLVSLDEEAEEGVQFAAAESAPASTVDPRVETAVDTVLAALSPEDKFVLAAYYLDDHTLAEIARILKVHESTISRKLDKLAKSLRKQVLSVLSKQGMGRRQAQEALEVDIRDLAVNIRGRLSQERHVSPFQQQKEASAEEEPK
jgi:RNA polymerase sigma-70 factor (ECF subfamily)